MLAATHRPSYECERAFSELGDLLESRSRCISPELLPTIQCSRRWRKADSGGCQVDEKVLRKVFTCEQMIANYKVDTWDEG
jgi:hypothetical protein